MSLAELTTEQLEEITNYGSTFLTPEQVEIILEIEGLADLIDTKGSDAYRAYHKGFWQSVYLVRKNKIEMARNGSSPAQKDIEKLIEDYEWKQI